MNLDDLVLKLKESEQETRQLFDSLTIAVEQKSDADITALTNMISLNLYSFEKALDKVVASYQRKRQELLTKCLEEIDATSQDQFAEMIAAMAQAQQTVKH